MTELVFYLLLFVVIGFVFVAFHLLLGRLIRPVKPDPDKLTIYECGEPTIGSAWIQFDLRFYVVALLFVIFDVEVAFFFPWAVVFGKATALASVGQPHSAEAYKETGERAWQLVPPAFRYQHTAQHNLLVGTSSESVDRLQELRQQEGVGKTLSAKERAELRELETAEQRALVPQQEARRLAWLAL